jgi:hypothetical protein
MNMSDELGKEMCKKTAGVYFNALFQHLPGQHKRKKYKAELWLLISGR